MREQLAVVKPNTVACPVMFCTGARTGGIWVAVNTICAVALLTSASVLAEIPAKRLVFPNVTAASLNGDKVSFPEGLRGERNLVIVAFKREQQRDIDTWLAVLPALAADHPGFAWYEVPVIDRLNPMVRWFIDSGMRRGIPDKAQRGRTVTFYIDKKPFRDALEIQSEDSIYLFLLDRRGVVLWQGEGAYTDAEKQELIGSLREGNKTDTKNGPDAKPGPSAVVKKTS